MNVALATAQEKPMLMPPRPLPLGDRQPASSTGPHGLHPNNSSARENNLRHFPARSDTVSSSAVAEPA